jgi:hypothetical protein
MIGIGMTLCTGVYLRGVGQDATLAGDAEPSMTTQSFMPATADVVVPGGSRPVPVPLNRRTLGPVPAERVRRLRKHLVESLRGERELKHPERSASPLRPEPEGFAGMVARAACALCGGWCCKGGEEHAYLDERTMARVRRARPELDARAVIRLYTQRVPAAGFEGSCVFHGARGCTLDRALRSDVCNSYFCSGLGHFVKDADSTGSVVVVAGEGEGRRVSPLLRATVNDA